MKYGRKDTHVYAVTAKTLVNINVPHVISVANVATGNALRQYFATLDTHVKGATPSRVVFLRASTPIPEVVRTLKAYEEGELDILIVIKDFLARGNAILGLTRIRRPTAVNSTHDMTAPGAQRFLSCFEALVGEEHNWFVASRTMP